MYVYRWALERFGWVLVSVIVIGLLAVCLGVWQR